MSRGRARFTEAELRRAAKVAAAAGMAVEILPDGTIRVVPIPPRGRSLPDLGPRRAIPL